MQNITCQEYVDPQIGRCTLRYGEDAEAKAEQVAQGVEDEPGDDEDVAVLVEVDAVECPNAQHCNIRIFVHFCDTTGCTVRSSTRFG